MQPMATVMLPPDAKNKSRILPTAPPPANPAAGVPPAAAPTAQQIATGSAPAPTPQAAMARPQVFTPPEAMSPSQRFSPERQANMEDRLGAGGARRIGGRGAKPGATFRQGEFKGMTAGQAVAKMAGEDGTRGQWKGLDGHAAMQRRPLAQELGLTKKPATQPGAMSPTARAHGVQEFRNSPGVVARNRYEATQPVQSTPGTYTADAKKYGTTTPPAAVAPPPVDPTAEFRRSLGAMAAPMPAVASVTPPPTKKPGGSTALRPSAPGA